MTTSSSTPSRSWQVLLLGGASGCGKTSVSYRLAHYFDIGITEVDDFHQLLEAMTTPQQQPIIHYWRTHPEAKDQPAGQLMAGLIETGRVMDPGLCAVIANHLESNTPLILEGDFILPELAARSSFASEANAGRVRGVFIYESDEEQILSNYSQREADRGLQLKRAHVSWLYSQWLKQEAERFGLIAIPSRPWETLLERVIASLT